MNHHASRQSLNSRRVYVGQAVSVHSERQTDRETVWIINMKDRVPCLYNDHWWHSFRSQVPVLIHMRSCIISTPNRVSSLDVYSVSLVNKSLMNKYSCMTLTHPWHSCMTHHDQSFVFECQVSVQMSQVCPVFQSRSLCQDFYIHRLPPLVSPSPPKTKKQIFYKFVHSFPSFCWTCSFQVHVLFLRHWGWYQMTKKKNRSVVPPILKGLVFDFFFLYQHTHVYEMWIYIRRYIPYVYIYTYIYVCICVCPCIIRYVYGCIYGFRHSYVYMRTWSMYFWRSSHEFERARK